ncbi:MAG: hypothetical protein QM237_06755 [Bacteroidota bacterium]|nr:hypothetical protein [Bacteroidota bacterium]HHU95987.1 hypothetical protein [Petrimonas sp.]
MASKVARIVAYVIVGIISLNVILFLLFSVPSVQRRAARFALEKVQPMINTRVSLDGVRVRFFNKVDLNGLYLEDQRQDTLLYTGRLTVRIVPIDLLSRKVMVEQLSLEDFVINVYRPSPDEPFNFQFIIDSFAGEKGAMDEEKDKGEGKEVAEDMFEVEDGSKEVKKRKSPWRITSGAIRLKNGSMSYHVLSAPTIPGVFSPNHIDARELNLRANIDFQGMDKMRGEVKRLSFQEYHSGLQVDKLALLFKSVGTRLECEWLDLTFNDSNLKVRDARFDREAKEFAATVESDRLEPDDAAMFAAKLNHLDQPMSFELEAEGAWPLATVKHLDFRYGPFTRFILSAEMADCLNFATSDLKLQFDRLAITQEHLEALIRIWAPAYTSPVQLTALGNLDLRLTAAGKIPLFRYDIAIDTERGEVLLNGIGKMTNRFKHLVYGGPVRLNDISVAHIIGEKAGVGITTLATDATVSIVQGEGVTVEASGNIESTTYKGLPYRDLFFDCVYSGTTVAATVTTDSELNKLKLAAGFSFGEEKEILLDGVIDRLDMRPFLMVEGWKMPTLATRLNAHFVGKTFDDLTGSFVMDQTSLMDSSFYYNPGPIYLQASVDPKEGKKIEIASSILDGEITGDYYFSTIGKELAKDLQLHLPSLIAEGGTANQSLSMDESLPAKNNFTFNFLLKNTEDVSHAFSLPFYNVEHAVIEGVIDLSNNRPLRLDAYVPQAIFGNNDVRETWLELESEQKGIGLAMSSYLVQDKGYLHARLRSAATGDSLVNHFEYDLNQVNTKSNGNLLIAMDFLRDWNDQLGIDVRVHPTSAQFNGRDVTINKAAIDYRKDSITVRNFGVRQDEMLLFGLEGVASKSEEDNIRLYFNNTEMATILAAFDVTNISGSLKGEIFVQQALETPMIHTEALRVEHIALNNDTIGTLRIEGDWDQIRSGLNVNAYLENGREKSLEIKGYVPTGEASPLPLDVALSIDNFELRTIQPLATTIFSDLKGRLNSRLHIGGKLSEPLTQGWLGIEDGELKVAYTNVTYYLSDTIRVGKDNVGLTNLVIRDQNNRAAMLDLQLSHTNFGGMAYTANVRLDDFMLLNNKSRTDLMLYGNLRLSGNVSIAGSSSGIFGDGRLYTRSQSDFTVVLPQSAKAIEYTGIVYINTPSEDSLSFLHRGRELTSQINASIASGLPIVMRATVNLSPQLTAGVVLDPTTGNALEINGEGELSVNYNSKSTPQVRLYGDYVINEGKFHYNLQNLRAIDFSIRDGSRLTMAGHPLNTRFDITAFLPVRTDLTALSPTFAQELKNTRVPVNALLWINGNLDAMDLKYDIELPESSSDIQQRVNSLINTEETKILQFAYLATTGSFIPSQGSPDVALGSSMFTNFAANYLSRGLDALFASALRDNWTVSTNLQTLDGTLDNARMGLDVSTRLLNNRLRISTNLSYGDKSMLASQQAFMGEFDLEYDINNWLMLRAFNRANERFSSRAPVTQGVGFMVTKEGQSLSNLFDFRYSKPKEEK